MLWVLHEIYALVKLFEGFGRSASECMQDHVCLFVKLYTTQCLLERDYIKAIYLLIVLFEFIALVHLHIAQVISPAYLTLVVVLHVSDLHMIVSAYIISRYATRVSSISNQCYLSKSTRRPRSFVAHFLRAICTRSFVVVNSIPARHFVALQYTAHSGIVFETQLPFPALKSRHAVCQIV